MHRIIHKLIKRHMLSILFLIDYTCKHYHFWFDKNPNFRGPNSPKFGKPRIYNRYLLSICLVHKINGDITWHIIYLYVSVGI